ncbi:DUF6069 family protein [Nocardiopsis ganjiahuensis]|uniref:DUF6069 family protein n=1 Tax=Nocardiopsis ganjiahuensis TaxID=239984 RepID=UPI00034CEAA5|nr:DUF6069 family protein [Nocardiopsis ganjiahuensis]
MTETSAGPRTATRPSWQPRLAAVVAVAAVNSVIALIAPLVGADMVVAPPGQEATTVVWPMFLVFSAGFGLIGWGALALAERLLGARRGRLVWTVAAVAVTLLMFAPPLTAGASTATVVVLELTHVVVAAIVVPVFWSTSRAS